MPYIKQTDRSEFDTEIYNLFLKIKEKNASCGDLNYILSKIVWTVFEEKPSYTNANMLMGMLQGVQQEFYRRKVAPYEDQKIQENGDI